MLERARAHALRTAALWRESAWLSGSRRAPLAGGRSLCASCSLVMPVATSPRSPRRPSVVLRGASWDFEPAGFDGGETELGVLGAGRRLHSAYALQAQCLRALLGCLAVIAGFLVFDRTAGKGAATTA